MRTAPVVNVENIGTGVTKPKRVTQEKDGITNDAAFKYEDTDPGIQSKPQYIKRRYNESDRYVYDVAAYKLDRMLDWQMVPTAVIAEVEGDEGALSDWVGNAINERDRLERELPFNGYCKQYEQYRLRFVFDILIHNDDRNLTNILWTKDGFMMQFIDHSLAFRSTERRPKQYRKVDPGSIRPVAITAEVAERGESQARVVRLFAPAADRSDFGAPRSYFERGCGNLQISAFSNCVIEQQGTAGANCRLR